MVQLDWSKLLAVTPEDMSEQDKEDLYESVAWYAPDSKIQKNRLIILVRVCQEILKFKAEQVESLVNELDEIASRQGEQEARNRQELLDELEDLRAQVAYNERMGRGGTAPSSQEEMRSELVRLEMQNEELISELQEREKELLTEKVESENYASIVASLEREKLELTRELAALHEETAEKSSRNLRDSPEFTVEKQEELSEIIRQKNRHITQLLSDANLMEEENNILREKLSHTRDDLSEATKHINEMTQEISKLKHLNNDLEQKYKVCLGQNQSLSTQIEELIQRKQDNDKELDTFAASLDAKVQGWKQAIESKDKEIEKLKQELSKCYPTSHSPIRNEKDVLRNKVKEQDEQIESLQNELTKATEEINKSTEVIEKFKEQISLRQDMKCDSQVPTLEQKIIFLEEKLKYAEEDAQEKAKELSEMIIKMRNYESGEFGLAEASANIKQLKKQIEIRDQQIEELVEACNQMKEEVNLLEDQNMAYHEKLGLPLGDTVDTCGIRVKRFKEQQLIKEMQNKLDQQEDKCINLELKNRKLNKIIKKFKLKIVEQESASSSNEEVDGGRNKVREDMEERLDFIVKENEALRKGMHEILESIQEQNVRSVVEVKSECLETLLHALDSRHISGWYHPAMRLQAQVHNLEGNIQELRNLIKFLRSEDQQKSLQITEAYNEIERLQSAKLEYIPESEVKNEGSETTEEALKISTKIIELEVKIEELEIKERRKERETEEMLQNLQQEKENCNIQVLAKEAKIKVLEEHLEVQNNDEELKKKLAEDAIKCSDIASNFEMLNKRLIYLKDLIKIMKKQNSKLKEDIFTTEDKMLTKIVNLQTEKSNILIEVGRLELQLDKSVSFEEFNSLKEEMVETNAKFRKLLNAEGPSVDLQSSKEELVSLKEEKENLLEELEKTKQKLISTQTLLNTYSSETVTQDNFNNQISLLSAKLAAAEVKEINEKHKAEHFEKMNNILKTEQQELNFRNKELLDQINILSQTNYTLQEIERNLRLQMQNWCSQEEFKMFKDERNVLEQKLQKLEVEKENIQELLDISHSQFKHIEVNKEFEKLFNDNLMEQVLVLQSGSDEKAAIARLSHELLTTHLKISELSATNNTLKTKISKLTVKNLCLEAALDEANQNILNVKKIDGLKSQFLLNVINDLRCLYAGALPFPTVEKLHETQLRIIELEKEAKLKVADARHLEQEYKIKYNAMEIQLDSLQSLKNDLKNGNNKKLISLHNKSTELRLNESKARLQNEYYQSEIEQLENHVEKLRNYIMEVESEHIKKEKDWEQKQILWEQSHLELYKLLKTGGNVEEVQIAATPKKEPVKPNDTSKRLDNALQVVKDQTDTIRKYESEISKLQSDVRSLSRELDDSKNDRTMSFSFETKENHVRESVEDTTEKTALKETIESLQNIISQKEETIIKFQNLLKEGRDEHSKAATRLQEEIQSLQSSLSNQNQAYNKLKNNVILNHANRETISSSILEKYINKIHELEDDVTEAHNTVAQLNTELKTCKHEVDRWRKMAEDRLSNFEKLKRSLDHDHGDSEDDLIPNRNYHESTQLDSTMMQELQAKLQESYSKQDELQRAMQELKEKLQQHSRADRPISDPSKHTSDFKKQQEINSLKQQLKTIQEENDRIKNQNKTLQSNRRPSSSSTIRSNDNKPSVKEEILQNKIKELEEEIHNMKEKQEDNYQRELKRLKSNEEVSRWDERKKSQQTIEKLNNKVKERENEIEIFKNKYEVLKNIVQRIERERNILENQLKSEKSASSASAPARDDVLQENRSLKTEIECLKVKLEAQICHKGGLGTALLEERLENQERKIVAMELAAQGDSQITEELVRLQTVNSTLEKANLKLESENLEINLKLEKEKGQVKHLTDQVEFLERHIRMHSVRPSKTEEQRKLEDLISEQEKIIFDLKRTVDRLTHENKRLIASESPVRSVSAGTNEKLKQELIKLRDEHKKMQGRYLECVQKNSTLEDELEKCKLQIKLLEEKDLVGSLSKTSSLQLNSDLQQEIINLKTQLQQKAQLLDKVKVLLKKAAAKEKILHDQLLALRSLVPADVLRSQNI